MQLRAQVMIDTDEDSLSQSLGGLRNLWDRIRLWGKSFINAAVMTQRTLDDYDYDYDFTKSPYTT